MGNDTVRGYVARRAGGRLEPAEVELPPLGNDDVEIAVSHCGVCRSDVHLIDGDWGEVFPLVPGHEVVGTVVGGAAVAAGTRVGVGWHCGSCGACDECRAGEEELCSRSVRTCVGRPGGFATRLRVPARFTTPIPAALASDAAAPLFCAGLTVWSPLRRYARAGAKVAVVGVGGLGHLALQLAAALGCEVTAISRDPGKRADALRFGAADLITGEPPRRAFDLVLNTAPAPPDLDAFLSALRPRGIFCQLADSRRPLTLEADRLITGNRGLVGSDTGSLASLLELLGFAAARGIRPQVEAMPIAAANRAVDLTRRGAARYRIVLVA